MIVVLCAITALFLAVLPLGAIGAPGEETGFSAQVLLNKPGVTFDPAPLQNYADKDQSVVVKVVTAQDYNTYDDDTTTYDDDISYDNTTYDDDATWGAPDTGEKQGGGDPSDATSDETVTEGQKDTTDDTGSSIDDFMWAPGTYYIYRSHYNNDLGVVVSQVDESYPYFDENGYQEKWVNLSGVQVTIVIPTTWEYQNTTQEYRELTVEQEVPLNNSLIDLAVSLGYQDDGGYTYELYYTDAAGGSDIATNGSDYNETAPPEPSQPDSYNMLYFTKDNVSVIISSGLGGKTMEGPSMFNQTSISISGPGGETDKEPYVSDIKKMLAHIGLNPSLWNGATFQSYTYPVPVLVPAINIDMSKMDWPAAMRAELEWLMKEKVVSGLFASDVNDICNLTDAGSAWMYDRVMYMDGSWVQGSAFWADKMPALMGEGSYGDSVGLTDPTNPKSGGQSDSNANNVGSSTMPMTIFAPGTASTEGKNTGMPQMTMIIAIIALCATFFIIVLLGVLMFTRLRRNSILDNLNRKNIYEMVKSKPGVHFNELIRTLDMQPGVLSHHLNVLESEEYIKSLQDANHRRFYLYGENTERKIMLTDIQLKILGVVSKSPGISQSNISKSIGRNRMIVNYHIKILRDVNMLLLEKSGRESMCYVTDVAKLSLAS